MTCSRSCEIFALLYFLLFGESLGIANNKRKDLMINSGKSRISTQNELREMKFQKCLSNTILCKAKRENNKLRNYRDKYTTIGGPSLSVCLPCLGILKLILTVYLILMISDNFVNTNIRQGCQNISYNGNNPPAIAVPFGVKNNMKA